MAEATKEKTGPAVLLPRVAVTAMKYFIEDIGLRRVFLCAGHTVVPAAQKIRVCQKGQNSRKDREVT
jgi:hypothetical protein